MDIQAFIKDYWHKIAVQDRLGLAEMFTEDAIIRWHNTNEEFTREEFIKANCDYPGEWHGNVERIEINEDYILTISHFMYALSLSLKVIKSVNWMNIGATMGKRRSGVSSLRLAVRFVN